MDYYGNGVGDSSIKHWKYIDKKRVNGKWVYYYEDSKGRLDDVKRALSSRDEAEKFVNVKDVRKIIDEENRFKGRVNPTLESDLEIADNHMRTTVSSNVAITNPITGKITKYKGSSDDKKSQESKDAYAKWKKAKTISGKVGELGKVIGHYAVQDMKALGG